MHKKEDETHCLTLLLQDTFIFLMPLPVSGLSPYVHALLHILLCFLPIKQQMHRPLEMIWNLRNWVILRRKLHGEGVFPGKHAILTHPKSLLLYSSLAVDLGWSLLLIRLRCLKSTYREYVMDRGNPNLTQIHLFPPFFFPIPQVFFI